MSKKAVINETLAIILLIVGLAAIVVLWLSWGSKGKAIGDGLNNLFTTLWNK